MPIVQPVKLFSNDWFKIWQWLLLIAVNSPIKGLREEVRHRLGIILDRNIRVDRLLKNSFRIRVSENEYQETFYGKNIFAHSVHKELLWLWNTIHKWDMNFANKVMPALNLGFDTLTAYPDASPEITTIDAMFYKYAADFSSCRGAASADGVFDGSYSYVETRAHWDGADYLIYRGLFLFNTNVGGGTVSAATLSLYRSYGLNNQTVYIVTSNPASNTSVVNADYSTLGATSLGSFSAVSGNNDVSLTTTSINLSGISKYGVKHNYDFSGTTPGEDNRVQFLSRDGGGTSGPKLVVTYTPAPAGQKSQMVV